MSSPDAKVSRYRSVRNAANAPEVVPSPDDDSSQAADSGVSGPGVNRSRSRYHRKPGQSPQQTPWLTQSPDPAHSPPLSQHSSISRSHYGLAEPAPHAQGAPAPRTMAPSDPAPKAPSPRPANSHTMSPHAEAERKRRQTQEPGPRPVTGATATTGSGRGRGQGAPGPARRGNPGQRHDSPMFNGETSPQKRPTASQAPQNILATTVDTEEEKSAGCFGGLFRKKKPKMVHQKPDKVPETAPKQPQYIKAGGGGIVPGTDAPKSAVNSGERRVLVECNEVPMQFPVLPTTTPADLLQSAANVFSDPIDPKTAILVENFTKVGIQRPLRRYEHVRDIMNSWDDDRQNSLIIMSATEHGTNPNLLQANNVPKQRPPERVYLMWLSQKVGKWDKRYIGIKTDGQVYGKKSSFAPDEEAFNICHLSDFDIYTPTQRQIAKKIKPPKKICFGIKSQQKSSMFETSVNFVHFFCTDEKDEAINFYTAIHGWRSWYLVNMMGEGKGKMQVTGSASASGSARGRNAPKSPSSVGDQSIDSYQIGTFAPLVDTDKIVAHAYLSQEKEVVVGPSQPRRQVVRPRPAPPPTTQAPIAPPQELDSHELLVSRVPTRSSTDGGASGTSSAMPGNAFATNGLLGASYDQRQRDATERDTAARELSGQPFTAGPSLLNGRTSPRQASSEVGFRRDPSTRDSLGRTGTSSSDSGRRQDSRRGNSVDITRNGSGSGSSGRAQQKPLVDVAAKAPRFQNTQAYSSLTGRADPTSSMHGGGGAGNGAQTDLGGSANAASGPSAPAPLLRREKEDNDDGFVPGGLLEHAAGGWGAGDKGRGVVGSATGATAPDGRTLVDLGDESVYAPGSLLARREAADAAASAATNGMGGGAGAHHRQGSAAEREKIVAGIAV